MISSSFPLMLIRSVLECRNVRISSRTSWINPRHSTSIACLLPCRGGEIDCAPWNKQSLDEVCTAHADNKFSFFRKVTCRSAKNQSLRCLETTDIKAPRILVPNSSCFFSRRQSNLLNYPYGIGQEYSL